MYKFMFVPELLVSIAAMAATAVAVDQTTSHSLRRASTVESLKVYNGANENLGKIKDLVIDPASGKVVYAVLDFGGFLGIGDKLFAVPWHAFQCAGTGNDEHLVLDVSKERLKNAPGFDKDHWPNMADPTFSQGIDKFYGPEPTARRTRD